MLEKKLRETFETASNNLGDKTICRVVYGEKITFKLMRLGAD